MHSKLSLVEIKPKLEHRYTLIWLHGLGADGHDFEGIVPELHLIEEAHIHFIFPDAPVMGVTINGGMSMRAWFDILALAPVLEADIAGIYRSSELVERLIHDETDKGIPSKNIILAGFSQGGAIALHTGLRFPHPLGGIIALSTLLPTIEQLKTERAAANNNTPILMAHGILDSVVAVEHGKKTCDELKAMQYPVEWHDFMMEHSVCLEEIKSIADFINLIFL